MRNAIAKKMRQQADRARNQAIGVLGPALNEVNSNEGITRQRVDKLEEEMGRVLQFRARGFLARLKWLFSGR